MDDDWQAQFDYNATTNLPDYQISCWSKGGFEERFSAFPKLLEKIPRCESVLDVGCGPGPYCRFLKDKGFQVIGVDYAPLVIELAKRKHPDISFQEANGYDLPFKDKEFDLVISIGALQCLEDETTFIGELARTAKKAIILSTLRRSYRVDDPKKELGKLKLRESTPVRLYHPDELIPLLKQKGFSVELVTGLDGNLFSDCFFLVGTRL